MGYKSQASGQAFENLLDLAHNVYRARGAAWIEHNGLRAHYRGGRLVAARKSAPDYYGCVAGRMIAFDAKSYGSDRWKLSKDRIHQYEYLLAIASAGGVAFFAVEHSTSRKLHLILVHPDLDAPVLWTDRRPAITFSRPDKWPEAPAGFELPVVLEVEASTGGYYDWLPVISEAWMGTEQRAIAF